MRVFFIVNDPDELLASMTTSRLIAACANEDVAVCVAGVADLMVSDAGQIVAFARSVPNQPGLNLEDTVGRVRGARGRSVSLQAQDSVWVRTNPARDRRPGVHRAALALLALAEGEGVLVLNSPAALHRGGNKLYLSSLPSDLRPPTIVASRAQPLKAFLRNMPRGVLKPLTGTRGRGVFLVNRDTPNINAMIDLLLEDGPVVAQGFADGAESGDVRVMLVDGHALTVDGRVAAIARAPHDDEPRSNLHAGAVAGRARLSGAQLIALERLGALLRADGIWCAGVDLVGTVALEVNIYSPGGLKDADNLEGRDFSSTVARAFLKRASDR